MITVCAVMAAVIPDMNIILCMALIIFACELGIITPMASGGMAFLASQKDYVSVGLMAKYGLLAAIFLVLIISIFGGFWSMIVFQ